MEFVVIYKDEPPTSYQSFLSSVSQYKASRSYSLKNLSAHDSGASALSDRMADSRRLATETALGRICPAPFLWNLTNL